MNNRCIGLIKENFRDIHNRFNIKFIGQAYSIKIRKPIRRFSPKIYIETEYPDMTKVDWEEQEYISLDDFDKFIIPRLEEYLERKKVEINRFYNEIFSNIQKFLSKKENREIIRDLLYLFDMEEL